MVLARRAGICRKVVTTNWLLQASTISRRLGAKAGGLKLDQIPRYSQAVKDDG